MRILPLEYSFKNTARDVVHTVLLNDYNMTVRASDEETVIPYANITNVRLCKVSGGLFRMVISYGGRVLIVTNQFVADNGAIENRSRLYATFVRILHFHLKDKSTALYKSGCSREKLWRSAIFAATFSFTLCFVADFLGFHILNPYVDAIILSALFIGVLIMMQLGRLPKDYSSTNIPFELLPAA
jgi:hypothetical protein